MKSKKTLCIISLIIVLSMLFSACTGSRTNVSSDDSKTSTADSSSNTPLDSGDKNEPVVKEKLTLKILTFARADFEIGNDMPVFQELEKLTNVHLDFELLPVENPLERFTAAMAAREPFDLVTFQNGPELNKYGMEGVFIPLQDLINEHAPNIKKGFENPLAGEQLPYKMNINAEITSPDGNIYFVPAISAANAIGAVFCIREDWLKKLNLEIPETAEDLYNVLKAFKLNDPNGNGEQDELPLVTVNYSSYLGITPLLSAFDAHMGLYLNQEEDAIKFGPAEQVWKDGMAFLNRLYKEGLIDPDYSGTTPDTWKAKVSGNQAGMMFAWPMSGVGGANNELKKIDESYKFVVIKPLLSPNGKRYKDCNTAGSYIVPRTAITASNKHPVETTKYLDFMYSKAGTELAEYGVKGLHYEIVNGKPVISDYILKNPEGLSPEAARLKEGVNIQSLPFMMGWESHIQVMKGPSPETIEAYTIYREPGMVEAPVPTLHFKDEEQEKGPQLMKEIITFANSKVNPFIKGEEPLDKYDDYVAQMKKMGLDEALKIYNDAYARYKSHK